MAEEKKKSNVKQIQLGGLLIGLVLLVVFGFLTVTSKLASVNPNPYLSSPSLLSIFYGVLFGIGFVVFVTFLTVIYEESRGIS